ncbi:MAG: hypothetical protein ACR2J3_06615 [Aridibacter sp.]
MLRKVIYSVFVFVFVQSFISVGLAQGKKANPYIKVERNNYSPNLYADRLNMQIILVDLPGAETANSKWQTSYKVYFVSEKDFDNTIPKIGRRTPTPNDFSSKILLAEGTFNKNALQEISQRIIEKKAILFKTKIPEQAKTEFAKIIVFYSTKIYDAKLKQNIFRSDLFITPPFIDVDSEKKIRKNLFLNFFVNDSGKLYASNRERNKINTQW